MRTQRLIVWAAGLALAVLVQTPVRADHTSVAFGFSVTHVSDFHEPLATHGVWVEVEDHGRCWRPHHVAAGWRPYCSGYWVWTDCGWYWVSDEPWAWACYHYGRWYLHPHHGWMWVPDVVWGPSWVCWREGGGYVGWAPLPPHVRFHGEVIYAEHIRVEPAWFVFVQHRHFHEPIRPRNVIVNNTTIINQTVNITKIKRVEKTIVQGSPTTVVVNEGPATAALEKATAKRIRTATVRELAGKESVPPALKRKGNAPAPVAREKNEPAITPSQPVFVGPPAKVDEPPAKSRPRLWPQRPPAIPDDAQMERRRRSAEKDRGKGRVIAPARPVPPPAPPPAELTPPQPPEEEKTPPGKVKGSSPGKEKPRKKEKPEEETPPPEP